MKIMFVAKLTMSFMIPTSNNCRIIQGTLAALVSAGFRRRDVLDRLACIIGYFATEAIKRVGKRNRISAQSDYR